MTATTPTARLPRTRTRSAIAAARAVPALLPGFAYAAAALPPRRAPAAIRAPAGNVPFLPGHAARARSFTRRRPSTPAPGDDGTSVGALAGAGFPSDFHVYRAAWL